MEELKNNDNWYCYCILGEIKNNTESLEYPQNWMECYKIIDDFLKIFTSKSIRSYQDLREIKEIDDRGYARSNDKTAKTGGTLTWNEKNNIKICSLYLQEQFEKIVELEKQNIDYWDWIWDNFPQENTYVSFDENLIYGYLNKENIRSPKQLPDFILRLSPTNNPNKFTGINTEIQIAISKRTIEKIGIETTDNFIFKLGKVAKAVKIGRATSVYKYEYIDDGRNFISFPVETNFANRDKAKFSSDDRIKNWEVIFEE